MLTLPRLLGCALLCFALHGPRAQGQQITLHQAIAAGLAHLPAAQQAADQVDRQRAQILGARLRLNPKLYLNSEDLGPQANGFDFPNTTEDYGYIGQTFELDGKRGRRIRYAEAGVARAELGRQLALGQLAVIIAYAYWAAAAARATLAAYRDQLASYDRLVRYQNDRVQAGAAAEVDLLRTQIERDRVALALAEAERAADAADIELARSTGVPSYREAVLTDPLEAEGAPPPELPATEAIEQRLDVAIARAALPEADANIRLQHAYAVPDLDILGGYKRNSGFNTGYGALQYSLPLFNRNQGGIAEATAVRRLADDQLAVARAQARAEIETARSTFAREQTLVRTTLPGALDRARRNADIILDAYQSGGADLLRLLDAQQVLIGTRLLAIQTWSGYQHAAIALRVAQGEPL